MRTLESWIQAFVVWLLADERAQDAFEYLLVVGAVVVAMAAALIAGFALLLPEVVGLVCPAVDTAANPVATFKSCLGP
jgi:hypothetical protein